MVSNCSKVFSLSILLYAFFISKKIVAVFSFLQKPSRIYVVIFDFTSIVFLSFLKSNCLVSYSLSPCSTPISCLSFFWIFCIKNWLVLLVYSFLRLFPLLKVVWLWLISSCLVFFLPFKFYCIDQVCISLFLVVIFLPSMGVSSLLQEMCLFVVSLLFLVLLPWMLRCMGGDLFFPLLSSFLFLPLCVLWGFSVMVYEYFYYLFRLGYCFSIPL